MLRATRIKVNYKLGGVVTCYGNASAGSGNNRKGWTTARDWYMQFGVTNSLGTPS